MVIKYDADFVNSPLTCDSVNCLWSLYQMIYKYGFVFYRLAKWLESSREIAEIAVRGDKIKDLESDHARFAETRKGIEEILRLDFTGLGLRLTYKALLRFKEQRIQPSDPQHARRQYLETIMDIDRRLKDELENSWFKFISEDKAKLYNDQSPFGELVVNNFPSATADIKDAVECFALDKWTAAAHHCMGAIQVGLIVLAKDLGCTVDIFVDAWEDIINRVQGAVNALQKTKSKSDWKRMEPFYNEVISDLRAIQRAWRNPGAHFRRRYDEPEALKVLDRTKEFMQHLATRLQE